MQDEKRRKMNKCDHFVRTHHSLYDIYLKPCVIIMSKKNFININIDE